jgi:hypothetical protein
MDFYILLHVVLGVAEDDKISGKRLCFFLLTFFRNLVRLKCLHFLVSLMMSDSRFRVWGLGIGDQGLGLGFRTG